MPPSSESSDPENVQAERPPPPSNQRRPKHVKRLPQFHEFIAANEIPGFTMTLDGERLISFHLPATRTLILTTQSQLEFLSTATLLLADATYKIMKKRLVASSLPCTEERGNT